jgi:hypothetical protein
MTSRKAQRASRNAQAAELPHVDPPESVDGHPVFCLRHIHADFDLKASDLDKDAKASFAERLQTLASMTWHEIRRSPRHGLGTEKMKVGALNLTMPPAFEDADDVTVFRYKGKLPMVGVKSGDTFHIVAIERAFGELYDHGS